jgi:hypothetical protein
MVFQVKNQQLSELENYLEPDWDGEGAQPISPVTLQNAQSFLELLPVGTPDATPGIDGSIGLLWETTDTYIYVDIKPNGRVHYYYQLDVEPAQEDVLAAPFNAQFSYQCLIKAFSFMMRDKTS